MEFNYKAFIVIDGTDGSGKSTQAKSLVSYLQSQGKKAVYIHFPNYDDHPGMAIKTMLSGKYGETADDVNMYAASIMYTVDRYCALHGDYKQYFTDPDMIIVSDRYMSSNLIHQGAKIVNNYTGYKVMALSTELNQYHKWLYELEVGKCGLPEPDKMIYLSIHPEDAVERMDKMGKDRDIHEQLEFVKRSYYVGKYYAHYLYWDIIDANKTENEVFGNLVDIVEDILED